MTGPPPHRRSHRPDEPHALRAVVLAGGLAFEREVSLSSGTQVWEELVRAGVDAELRDADVDCCPGWPPPRRTPCSSPCTAPRARTAPCARCSTSPASPTSARRRAARRLAWDKPAAKSVSARPACPHPDWVALPHSTVPRARRGRGARPDRARLGLPLMVKPAQGGSALGAQSGPRVAELPAAMVGCFAYGDTALVERYVDGVELALSVVDLGDGPVALPAVEIVPAVGRLRLRGPVHARADRVPRAGPPRRRRGRARGRVAFGCTRRSGSRPLPHRRDRHAGRPGALPGGQRVPGADRDVAVADGGRGGRVRARRGARPACSPGGPTRR